MRTHRYAFEALALIAVAIQVIGSGAMIEFAANTAEDGADWRTIAFATAAVLPVAVSGAVAALSRPGRRFVTWATALAVASVVTFLAAGMVAASGMP